MRENRCKHYPHGDHGTGMCLDARWATAAPQAGTAQMNAVLVGLRQKEVDGVSTTDRAYRTNPR